MKRAIKRWLRHMGSRHWAVAKCLYRLHGLPLQGPATGHVWYFAYGSNLDANTFRGRRRMQPRRWEVGAISGFRLRFNLDGYPRGKAAPANITPHSQGEVWGVLYEITRRELVRLDSSEGVPGGNYRHVWVDARTVSGGVISVVTYSAIGNPHDGNPSLRYITLLRNGAREHGLPDCWIERLDAVEHAK
jgi:gamma-glutamylcyclotransferase (GGCT)/AIG2-like uncharacterized protein YtfP